MGIVSKLETQQDKATTHKLASQEQALLAGLSRERNNSHSLPEEQEQVTSANLKHY
jgi:hypothetical protein